MAKKRHRRISGGQALSLERLCRALAAHCLLTAHPNLLHQFLAPETAEQTAQFILRFANGEPLQRPLPTSDDR